MHERVKADYPGKPRQQKLLQATVAQGPSGVSVLEGVARVQLVDADALRLLSLGPDVMSVNTLRPYDGWTKFKARIDAAMSAYVSVSGAERVNRVGVRYVNRIVMPGHVEPSRYFNCGPVVPKGLPRKVGGFLSRAEYVFDDGVKLLLTFASIDAEKGASAFLLDLDVVWEDPAALDVEAALRKMMDLHEREGDAFEHVITDETRELFDG